MLLTSDELSKVLKLLSEFCEKTSVLLELWQIVLFRNDPTTRQLVSFEAITTESLSVLLITTLKDFVEFVQFDDCKMLRFAMQFCSALLFTVEFSLIEKNLVELRMVLLVQLEPMTKESTSMSQLTTVLLMMFELTRTVSLAKTLLYPWDVPSQVIL